jgi:PII-like signaling protein
MKTEKKLQMLRIFFGENDRWQEQPLYLALLDRCRAMGIAGATVFRGLEGYGASSTLHRERFWSFSSDAPIRMVILDTPEQIARLTPVLQTMVTEGVVVSAPVEAIHLQRDPNPKPSA